MIQSQRYRVSPEIELLCQTAGDPSCPLMFFLHGFPEAAFIWDKFLLHFSRPQNGNYFCVAPNLRGFAGSSSPTEVFKYRPKYLVQDILALHDLLSPHQPMAQLVAHDWGGAIAWNFGNQHPSRMRGLTIINSPHPGTFLRELKNNAHQQSSSAYMNFLIRPEAEQLLAQNDYRRLWEFFTNMGAADGAHAWLTDEVKNKLRDVWNQGLTGGLNYYRASPLRPPTPNDRAAAAIDLPLEMLQIKCPTQVIWGMKDMALPPALIDGLDQYVSNLTLHTIDEGTHWIIHEQPERLIQYLENFLKTLAAIK